MLPQWSAVCCFAACSVCRWTTCSASARIAVAALRHSGTMYMLWAVRASPPISFVSYGHAMESNLSRLKSRAPHASKESGGVSLIPRVRRSVHGDSMLSLLLFPSFIPYHSWLQKNRFANFTDSEVVIVERSLFKTCQELLKATMQQLPKFKSNFYMRHVSTLVTSFFTDGVRFAKCHFNQLDPRIVLTGGPSSEMPKFLMNSSKNPSFIPLIGHMNWWQETVQWVALSSGFFAFAVSSVFCDHCGNEPLSFQFCIGEINKLNQYLLDMMRTFQKA